MDWRRHIIAFKILFLFCHLVIDGNVNTGMADEEEKERRKRGVGSKGFGLGWKKDN